MAIVDELQRAHQLAAAGEHEAARRLAERLPPAVVGQGEYTRAWPAAHRPTWPRVGGSQ